MTSGQRYGTPAYIVVSRCPMCSGTLALRHRRHDRHPFFGCTSYPKCGFVASYDEALVALSAKAMHDPIIAELASRNDELERQVQTLRRDRARLEALERETARMRQWMAWFEDERARMATSRPSFHGDGGAVTAHDIRSILAWAHPDRHPDGSLDVHELAVRLTALLDRTK